MGDASSKFVMDGKRFVHREQISFDKIVSNPVPARLAVRPFKAGRCDPVGWSSGEMTPNFWNLVQGKDDLGNPM